LSAKHAKTTPNLHHCKAGYRKRRQVRHGESVLWRTAALPSGFAAETFVFIRVHSWLALPAQGGDEMAQLVFNLGRGCHRVRDFLTQQLPVTLSQPMEGLFDRVLGHGKLARNFRL
jgi:hypothetical protein